MPSPSSKDDLPQAKQSPAIDGRKHTPNSSYRTFFAIDWTAFTELLTPSSKLEAALPSSGSSKQWTTRGTTESSVMTEHQKRRNNRSADISVLFVFDLEDGTRKRPGIVPNLFVSLLVLTRVHCIAQYLPGLFVGDGESYSTISTGSPSTSIFGLIPSPG